MAIGIVALALVSVVQASPILTLFNTGVDASGVVLPNGSVGLAGDLHYTLTGSPVGAVTDLQARTADFPIPPWLGSDGLSGWIGPNSNTRLDGPVGDYTYQTTFDLSLYKLSTVVITGRWAMDNTLPIFRVNDSATADSVLDPTLTGAPFQSFSSFTIANGSLKQNLNKLEFVVNNASVPGEGPAANPTGLRVEFTASGDLLAPEPASFLLFGAGLVALSMIPRRRTRAAKSK